MGDTGSEPIHRVYDAIAEYMAENGLRQRRPTREVYLGPERFSGGDRGSVAGRALESPQM